MPVRCNGRKKITPLIQWKKTHTTNPRSTAQNPHLSIPSSSQKKDHHTRHMSLKGNVWNWKIYSPWAGCEGRPSQATPCTWFDASHCNRSEKPLSTRAWCCQLASLGYECSSIDGVESVYCSHSATFTPALGKRWAHIFATLHQTNFTRILLAQISLISWTEGITWYLSNPLRWYFFLPPHSQAQ